MEANHFKRQKFHELDFVDTALDWIGLGTKKKDPPKVDKKDVQHLNWTGPNSAGYDPSKDDSIISASSVKSAVGATVVQPFERAEKTVTHDASTLYHDIGVIADDFDTAFIAIKDGAEESFSFVENHYKLILFAVGAYMGAKFYNEINTAYKNF